MQNISTNDLKSNSDSTQLKANIVWNTETILTYGRYG